MNTYIHFNYITTLIHTALYVIDHNSVHKPEVDKPCKDTCTDIQEPVEEDNQAGMLVTQTHRCL